MDNNKRVIVDYNSQDNIDILNGLIEEVSSILKLDDNSAAKRYTRRAMRAVINRVNNDYINVLQVYPDEIIEIAIFNFRKDNIRNNPEVSSMTQGPLQINYNTSSSDMSSTVIPDYLLSSIKHYVRGY